MVACIWLWEGILFISTLFWHPSSNSVGTKATFLVCVSCDVDWSFTLVLIVIAKNVYILRYHARAWVWQRGNRAWHICAFQLYQSSKISADDRVELDQICSEHIASSVDLRWHIVSSGVRGRVSLKGITLTPEMLDIVRTSPLQWGRYFFHLYHSVTRFIRSGNLLL